MRPPTLRSETDSGFIDRQWKRRIPSPGHRSACGFSAHPVPIERRKDSELGRRSEDRHPRFEGILLRRTGDAAPEKITHRENVQERHDRDIFPRRSAAGGAEPKVIRHRRDTLRAEVSVGNFPEAGCAEIKGAGRIVF